MSKAQRVFSRMALGAVLFAAAVLPMGGRVSAADAPAGLVRCRGRISMTGAGKLPMRTVAVFTVFETVPRYRVLWSEVRTVSLDKQGEFDVILGRASSDGEPAKFLPPAGHARLTVEVEAGGAEGTRTLQAADVRVDPVSDAR